MTKHLHATVFALVAGFLCRAVGAQAPGPVKFEVTSVKPNKSGDNSSRSNVQPGGRFTGTNVTVESLIRNAYVVEQFQIIGAPAWIAAEHFDIAAKAEGDIGMPVPWEIGPLHRMLQSLLADRFGLVVHHETREQPIYSLELARSDRRLGPNLRVSATDCTALLAAAKGDVAAMPPPRANGQPVCGLRTSSGRMAGGGMPLSTLARALSGMGRGTLDRTGLTGVYDFDLNYVPLQSAASSATPTDSNGPSIFTALQEQLGLKLEAGRGPVDVLIIDRAERPRED